MPVEALLLALGFFSADVYCKYTVGHIRATLIKQHFISTSELLCGLRGKPFLSLFFGEYSLCLKMQSSQDVKK